MSYANWTTRFLVGNPQGSETPPEKQGRASAGDAAQGEQVQPGASGSLVGSRVGPYMVTKRLGEGGVGEVFKGVDVMLKREVAIKVLHPEFAADPLFVQRFSREAQLHAKLSHPSVATVHAFLHEGDKQFMVMEYVAGTSLDEFVRAGGPVPVERALSIFRRALDGIEHAHRSGIVHRDIKPANIMLADNGAVKVMDFGIARALDCHEHLTRHGQVAGTAKAMSPEQIRGAQADVRSDIYSLGIVLYTLLAGRPPFDGDSDLALMKAQLEQAPPPLRGLAADVPPEVEAAVMRALQKDPSARFQTVSEFSRALDACLVSDATAVLPKPRKSQAAPTMSRTAVNPALGQAQARPQAPAAVPPAAKAPGTRLRRVAAVVLVLSAVAAGAIVVGPHLVERAPADVSLLPIAVAPTTPPPAMEPSPAVPEPAAAAAPEPAAAAAPQPIQPPPPPRVDTVVPRTLAITRLTADGRPDSDTTSGFKPGERIRLLVTPSHDAHVYCYLQDEAKHIVRFFPNRFSQSARVTVAAPLEIPGPMRFEIVANARNVTETIACFASERDVMSELPAAVVGTDFARLPATSLDQVRSAFASTGADTLAQASFQVQLK